MQFLNFVLEESQVLKHIFVTIVKGMINVVCLVQKDNHSTEISQPTYGLFVENWNTCQ